MTDYQFPEDNPEHPDHDAAVAQAWKGEEQRFHCDLREMVDRACEGVMPHIAERIKKAARYAYYLGCNDGIQCEREGRVPK